MGRILVQANGYKEKKEAAHVAGVKEIQILKWLDNGCYPGYVMFSHGFSYDEIINLLKKKKNAKEWLLGIDGDRELIESGDYFALHRELESHANGIKKNLYYIIITGQFTFTDYEYCKLAHEVLHIANFFLQGILNRDMEYEAEAYYHTHLMAQCLSAIRGK